MNPKITLDHLGRDRRLAEIMKESRQSQVGKLGFRIPDPIAQGKRQEGHVHGVVMRVLVMAAEGGEPKQDRFVIHHEVHDVLNGPLGLFEARGPSIVHGLYHLAHGLV